MPMAANGMQNLFALNKLPVLKITIKNNIEQYCTGLLMKKMTGLLAGMAVLFLCQNIYAASESLTNVTPQISVPEYSPGAIILLPDGRKAVIDEAIPGGGWRTREGLVIDQHGILDGSGEKAILVDPSGNTSILRKGMRIRLPDDRVAIIEEVLPNGDLRTNLGIILAPDGSVRENARANQKKLPDSAKPAKVDQPDEKVKSAVVEPEKKAIPVIESQAQKGQPKHAARPKPKAEEDPLTLAEMLPLTRVPGEKEPKAAAKAPDEKTPHAKAPEEKHKAEAREKPKAEPEKSHKMAEPEKTHKKAAPEKKAQPKKAARHKTPIGQELKIPHEAAKSGNLDFLEGCWQGTRPEYYSKRTIRECFCFGPNGSNGKRRVIDPQGGRRCIGATRAHLSSGGVLSVTSDGAVCSDGERWGSAEMVCRNSGPRTPCSWVFRDANNGRQSYQIPFIRVESCGR